MSESGSENLENLSAREIPTSIYLTKLHEDAPPIKILSEALRLVRKSPKSSVGSFSKGSLKSSFQYTGQDNIARVEALMSIASAFPSMQLSEQSFSLANRILDQMQRHKDDHRDIEVVAYHIAQGYAKAGNSTGALEKSHIAHSEDKPFIYEVTVSTLSNKGNYQEAKRFALECDFIYRPKLLAMIAETQFKNGDNEGGKQTFDEAMGIIGEEFIETRSPYSYLRMLARIAEAHPEQDEERNKIKQKIEYALKEMLDSDPSEPYKEDALLRAAKGFADIGFVEDSKKIMQDLLLRLNENRPGNYENVAIDIGRHISISYERSEKTSDAIVFLNSINNYRELAELLIRNGQIDGALDLLPKMEDKYDHRIIRQQVSEAYAKKGDLPEALKTLSGIQDNFYIEHYYPFDKARAQILSGFYGEALDGLGGIPLKSTYDVRQMVDVLVLFAERKSSESA